MMTRDTEREGRYWTREKKNHDDQGHTDRPNTANDRMNRVAHYEGPPSRIRASQ